MERHPVAGLLENESGGDFWEGALAHMWVFFFRSERWEEKVKNRQAF